MKKILITLILLACTTLVHARGPELVATHTAHASESMDHFAKRITNASARLSFMLNAEVCGEFRQIGGVYTIELYTVSLPRACSYIRQGSGYTGQSYHTHLEQAPSNFSQHDYNHPGYMAHGRQLKHQNGDGNARRIMWQAVR